MAASYVVVWEAENQEPVWHFTIRSMVAQSTPKTTLTCIQGYKYGTAATPCIVWTEGDGTSAKDHDIDYIEIKERYNASSSSDYKNTVEAVARVVKGSTYATAGGATVTFASDGTVTASEYSGTLVGYRYMTLTEVSEQLASTQSALADADALNLDQDYRLTLLELGVTDDETTA